MLQVEDSWIRLPGYRQTLYSSQTPGTWNACAEATVVDGGVGRFEIVDSVVGDVGVCRLVPKSSKEDSVAARERQATPSPRCGKLGVQKSIVQSERGVTLSE